MKLLTKKYKLRQDFELTLYKTGVRLVIEYASEIWDGSSQSQKIKIRNIEHKAFTIVLGVTRLTERTETNLKAYIMLLELRRQKERYEPF